MLQDHTDEWNIFTCYGMTKKAFNKVIHAIQVRFDMIIPLKCQKT